MTWKPATLTREQIAERRHEGGRLLQQGKLTQAEIARQLAVSRTAVGQWARALARGGQRALQPRTSAGRPSKLSVAQRRELVRHLKRGALAAGFATDRWTLPRVQQLIKRTFQVDYHPNYLNRLLDRLGWSAQLPQPRAVERDEARVRAWLANDWPRIKKKRDDEAYPSCFLTSSAFLFWKRWAAPGLRADSDRCCVASVVIVVRSLQRSA